MPDITTAARVREPFILEFSWNDNWCSPGVAEACSQLPDDIKALYLGTRWENDDDMVAYLLSEHLRKGNVTDGDLAEQIADVVQTIGPHDGCECAQDAYQAWRAGAEEDMAGLGEEWAVLTTEAPPQPVRDLRGDPAFLELFEATGRRTWTDTKLVWDGRKLEVTFDYAVLDFVPLSADEAKLAATLEGEFPNCLVATTDPADLDVAVAVWDKLSSDERGRFWFEDFVKEFTGAGATLSDPNAQLLFTEMLPNWEAELASLLPVAAAATCAPQLISA